MTNTDFRSQEYNPAQGQSSSNNIYSSPLKDARELSLKAHDVSLEPMKAGEPNISGSQNVSFFENKKTLKQLVYFKHTSYQLTSNNLIPVNISNITVLTLRMT